MKTCSLCSSKLKFGNTPLLGSGKLSDGESLCTKCYSRVTKKDIYFKFKNKTIHDVKELLNEPNGKYQDTLSDDKKENKVMSSSNTDDIQKEDIKTAQKDWEVCPRCGSNSVKKSKPAQSVWGLTIGGLGFAGCGIWLLIIPILGIIMIISGLIAAAIGVVTLILFAFAGKSKQLECKSCELVWEYGQYKGEK